MRNYLPLLGLLLVAPSMADTIYKWVDENGQMHFSDMPRDDATEVEVASPQTFSAPRITTSSSASQTDDDDGQPEAEGYESIEIASPAQEETIWNTGGKVTVAINTQPALMSGHRVTLLLDGQAQATLAPGSTSVELSEVFRGEHQLQAEVRDENNQTLASSRPVTFFYQQTSVNRRPGL